MLFTWNSYANGHQAANLAQFNEFQFLNLEILHSLNP